MAMQAAFYLGLSQFFSGQYAQAEQSFRFVAARLPLPAVVNDAGVAATRHGKSGVADFQQAVASDPQDEDYHFNLAVAEERAGNLFTAASEIKQAIALAPSDTEAQTVQQLIQAELSHGNSSQGGADSSAEPLERIKRTLDETALRQAAFALEQVTEAGAAAQPPAQRAATEVALGDKYLAEGLLLEAEQAYQRALAADANNASALAGIADVRLRTGNVAAAKTQAEASLRARPNALAYLVLASTQIQANDLQNAASSVGKALQLDPQNATGKQLKQQLQARGVSVP
jgi:tetratricopeptide (TPR) repeat protein